MSSFLVAISILLFFLAIYYSTSFITTSVSAPSQFFLFVLCSSPFASSSPILEEDIENLVQLPAIFLLRHKLSQAHDIYHFKRL